MNGPARLVRLFPKTIRPEERRDALVAFVTLFGIVAGHALLETARDALFLKSLPAARLPWVYLAVAAAAVVLIRFQPRPRVGSYGSLAAVLLGSAVVTAAFWLVLSFADTWALYALYVWSGVLATVALIQFWSVMGERFTVSEAKRVFAPIGAGSVLGALAGTGVAGIIVTLTDARHLLLAASAVLALTAMVPAALGRLTRGVPRPNMAGAPPPMSLRTSARQVWEHPYAKRLATVVLIAAVTLTIADYLFKAVVDAEVADEDLGTFLAAVYLSLNALSLLVQLALVNVVLRRLGPDRALIVLPLLLLASGVGLLFSGGLVAALLLKGGDGAFRYSLHRTGTELLYVPMSDELRRTVKGFIDAIGQRGGQALASLAILLAVSVDTPLWVLAAAVVVLAAVWALATQRLRRPYLDVFRATLREGAAMGAAVGLPPLDMASLEALIETLNSPNDAEVLAGLDLLAAQERARLIPALILYHPSPRVVVRALEILSAAGRTDFVRMTQRLLSHRDAEVRSGALRAATAVRPDPELLATARRHVCSAVAATARVGAVATTGDPVALAELESQLAHADEAAQLAAARAVRMLPSDKLAGALLSLSEASSLEVRRAAIGAMVAIDSARFLPALLRSLAERSLRASAREALLAQGLRALDALEAALADESLPPEVRWELPMAIRRFEPAARAAAILVQRLLSEDDGLVRYKILRALGRIQRDHPQVVLDRGILTQRAEATVKRLYELLDWRLTLERHAKESPRCATPVQRMLVTMLANKERHGLERLFRLLGLIYPQEDFHRIYVGLNSRRADVRASSRELTEHVVSQPLQQAVLGLVEERPDLERVYRAGPYHAPVTLDYEAVLTLLIDSKSHLLRCLAVHHAGELRYRTLKKRLSGLETQHPELMRVRDRALAALKPAKEAS